MKVKKWLFLGLLLEISIVILSYIFFPETDEAIRYMARYSGRLSLLSYLIVLWFYMISSSDREKQLQGTRSLAATFAILHYIHLFLLWLNVQINTIPIIPFKLAGGALAYLMILLYPIFFPRLKNNKTIHAIYFLYVGFVMAMTYIARMKGDFEGASPSLFHKIGLALVVSSMVFFIARLIRPRKI